MAYDVELVDALLDEMHEIVMRISALNRELFEESVFEPVTIH